MKVTLNLLSIVVIASATYQGITLPSNLKDGAYIITINEGGNRTIQDITVNIAAAGASFLNTVSINAKLFGRHRKRYPWPTGTSPVCPGGDWMVQTDFYDRAFNAFWDQCRINGNNKFPRGSVFANYQGESVGYMCGKISCLLFTSLALKVWRDLEANPQNLSHLIFSI